MRRIVAVVALGVLAACATSRAAVDTGGDPRFPATLGAARAGYAAAWGGTDRVALAAFFAEDARVIFRDYTLEGRARIDERWLTEDIGRVSELVMTPDRVSRAGDEVTEAGTVTLRFRREGGEVGAERGSYEHVWARQGDGTWKLRSVRMETHPAPR
jgi:ketosteroid isomerase-like protein